MFENWGAFAFISELLFVLTAAFNPPIQADERIAARQVEGIGMMRLSCFLYRKPKFPSPYPNLTDKAYKQNCGFWQHLGKNVATKRRFSAAANVVLEWEKAESHLWYSHYIGCIVTGKAQWEEGPFQHQRTCLPAGLGEKLTGLSCGIATTRVSTQP